MNYCPDCDAARMHAYSDATTAGFFFTKCIRHIKEEQEKQCQQKETGDGSDQPTKP